MEGDTIAHSRRAPAAPIVDRSAGAILRWQCRECRPNSDYPIDGIGLPVSVRGGGGDGNAHPGSNRDFHRRSRHRNLPAEVSHPSIDDIAHRHRGFGEGAMKATAAISWSVLDDLVHALLDPTLNGFEIHYQPIVSLRTRATVAVEALTRWRHPVVGYVDPEIFVLGAQRAGKMAALDDFALTRVCADTNALKDVLDVDADLHVNICAERLGQPSLESSVVQALDELHLSPERLVLEITETRRIDDLKAAAAAMQRMRKRGVRFALDDFGSGFNMLVHFHALPVDCIKLDAALTSLENDPLRTEAICRSVLTICKHVGATVIAEGIETRAQAQMLIRVGCRLGQGYLFGQARALETHEP
jgi:EAL domain-containing protein (putative c-di-GMP-specific phosphodiesterase class I)